MRSVVEISQFSCYSFHKLFKLGGYVLQSTIIIVLLKMFPLLDGSLFYLFILFNLLKVCDKEHKYRQITNTVYQNKRKYFTEE